jgi:hypothetical protein
VYNAEELASLTRWERASRSDIKYQAGPFPLGSPKKRGTLFEDRPNPLHQRRQIPRHHDRATTDQDLESAFSLMLWWARKVSRCCDIAGIRARCNAKTKSARAYQAASYLRDYHRLRMGIDVADIVAADIVIEAVGKHLRRAGRIGWWQRTATLDML